MHPEALLDQVLGHYRIKSPLGYGGTATVYLAEDIHLQRNVALKVYLPDTGETGGDFMRRFAREARVLAQLDHPHILPIYDYGEQDNLAYLVMPYMAGGSLRDYLHQKGPMPVSTAIPLISQILDALQYAHEHGLIHRDIKPGNMLFKANGTLVLSDFGLVKVLPTAEAILAESTTTTQTITGTPHYMAPEQIQSKPLPASDIYALGIVLYEMLTGKRPFTADNSMGVLLHHLYTQPRPPRELNPQIPPTIEAAILHAMEKDPQKRFQQPSAFRAALQQPSLHGSTTLTDEESNRAHSSLQPGAASRAITPVYLTPESLNNQANPSQPGISQQTPLSDPTPTRRQRRTLLTLLTTTLSFLLLAGTAVSLLYFNGIWPPASANMPTATPVPAASPSSVGQPTVDCPAPGTARKAVMTSINVGKTQNLVFIVNEGTPDNPHAGTIKRRDPVANIGYEMKKMANTYITEGQISQDGHWVLFIARTQGQYQLRLLRVDGQELQTLFCTSGEAKISNAQWSFDMHSIVFNVGSSLQTTYLLDITSGTVQPLLIPDGTDSYIPRAWLDNARLYLTAQTNAPGTIQHNIYLLDLRNGANQSEASLHRVDTNTPMCFDLDDSYDLTQLIMSTCNMPYYSSEFGTAKGPSSITTQPTGGGQPTTIYQNDTMAITTVRAVRPDILLFMVENFDDHQSQNGLWRVGMDGQSLQQLATDSDHTLSLCQFSQFSWSNVSRDGKMFALQGYNPKTREFKLYIGSMDHKGLNPFAGDDELNMPIVGWIQI